MAVRMNWKQISDLDEETIRSNPDLYIRTIILKKNWDKLLQCGNEPDLTQEVVKSLRFKNVNREIFKNASAQKIIETIDSAHPFVRYQLLLILIELYDTLPAAAEAGLILTKSPSLRPWILNEPIIRAFLPVDVLTHFLCPSFEINTEKDWIKLLEIKEFENISGPILSFNSPREYEPRKTFGDAVVKYFTESNLDNSKEVLIHFKNTWFSQPDLREKVLEHIINNLNKDTSYLQFLKGNVDFKFFDKNMLKWHLRSQKDPSLCLNEEYLMKKHVLPALYKDIQDPESKSDVFLSNLLSGYIPLRNFLLYLRENKELWDIVKGKYVKFISSKICAKNYSFFQLLVKNTLFNIQEDSFVLFSYNEIVNIIYEIIKEVASRKSSIIVYGNNNYTDIMTSILSILISPKNITPLENIDFNSIDSSCLLPIFSSEFKDYFLREVIVYPTNEMPLGQVFTTWPKTRLLSLLLTFDSLKEIGQIASTNLKCHLDKYGFYPEPQKITVPSLPKAEKNIATSIETHLHPWERLLFKSDLLKNPDPSIVKEALTVYKNFVLKIFEMANKSTDQELWQDAVDVHFHFCRIAIGKQPSELSDIFTSQLFEIIVHPLIISIGLKLKPTFLDDLYESMISIIFEISPKPNKKSVTIAPNDLKNIATDVSNMLSIVMKLTQSSAGIERDENLSKQIDTAISKLMKVLMEHIVSFFQDGSIPNVSLPNSSEIVIIPTFAPVQQKFTYLKDFLNYKASIKLTEKYKSLLMNNYLSNKLKKSYNPLHPKEAKDTHSCDLYNLYSSVKIPKRASLIPLSEQKSMVGLQTIQVILSELSKYVNSYNEKMYPFKALHNLIFMFKRYFADLIFRRLTFNLPPLPDTLSLKFTKKEYQSLLSSLDFNISYSLSNEKERILFKNILDVIMDPTLNLQIDLDLPLTYNFINDQNILKDFDNIYTFVPYSKETEKYRKTSFGTTILFEFKPNPNNKDEMFIHCSEEQKVIHASNLNDYGILSDITNPIVLKLLSLIKDVNHSFIFTSAQNIFNISKLLFTMIPRINTSIFPKNTDWSLLGLLMKSIINDFLIVDKKNEDEEEKNGSSETIQHLFNDFNVKIPIWKPHFGKGKMMSNVRTNARRSQMKNDSLSRTINSNPYKYDIYCLSILSDSIYSISSKLNSEQAHNLLIQFSDSLNNLLSLEPDILEIKFGKFNLFHFSESISKMALSLNGFTDTEAFSRLFGSNLFVHAAISHILSSIFSQSYDKRISTLKILASVIKSPHPKSVHFLTNVIGMLLSPLLVTKTIPELELIPDWCIEAIRPIANDVKMHSDVKKAIIANSINILNFMNNVGISPNHPEASKLISKLFDLMDIIFNSTMEKMLPIFCFIASPSTFISLSNENASVRELIPQGLYPEFMIIRGNVNQHLQFPYNESPEWSNLLGIYLQHYVIKGLMSHQNNVMQVVIKTLSNIDTNNEEVLQKTAEFLEKKISTLDPATCFTSLIGFAFSFCFKQSNQKYTGTINAFVEFHTRIKKFLDDINKLQIKGIWMGGNGGTAYEPINKLMKTNLSYLLKNFDNDIETTITLSKRIQSALGIPENMPFYSPVDWIKYQTLLKLLSSEDFLKMKDDHRIEHVVNILKLYHNEPYMWEFIKQEYVSEISQIDEILKIPVDILMDAKISKYFRVSLSKFLKTMPEEELMKLLPKLWMLNASE